MHDRRPTTDAAQGVPCIRQRWWRFAPTAAGMTGRLGLLLGYLLMPIDLVPDFVPVLGYVDDLVVIALVLRSTIRRAGPLPRRPRRWGR